MQPVQLSLPPDAVNLVLALLDNVQLQATNTKATILAQLPRQDSQPVSEEPLPEIADAPPDPDWRLNDGLVPELEEGDVVTVVYGNGSSETFDADQVNTVSFWRVTGDTDDVVKYRIHN